MLQKIKKIFFENINLKQTIFKNTFWLAISEGLASFLRFLLIVYAARILGADEYGKFAYALSFVLSLSIFGDMGLSSLITRDFSQEKEKEKDYPAIISLKIFLSAFMAVLLFVGSFFITNSITVREIIWVLTIYIFIDGFLNILYPFVRARQKMEYEAITKIAQTVITFVIGLFIIFNFPSPVNLGYAYLFSSLIVLTVVALLFHFFLYFLKLNWAPAVWKKLLKNSWPLALGFIGAWAQININSAMVGFNGRALEVGWYNVSGKLVLAIILISAGLVSRSFFPALSKLFKEEKQKLQKSWDYYMEIMIMLALPLVLGGLALAPKIIAFLYGLENYAPSVFIFKVLIILAGITFLYYPYSAILVAAGEQKKNFFVILSGIIVNIILNIILMPKYGVYAVSINTVVSSAAAFFLAVLFTKNYTPVKPFSVNLLRILSAAVFSGMIMFIVVEQPIIYNLHVLASVAVGFIVYASLFFTIKKIFCNL